MDSFNKNTQHIQNTQQEENIENIENIDPLAFNKDKLNSLISQTPFLNQYFNSISSTMSQNDAYLSLYQFVMSKPSLKNNYLSVPIA